MMPYRLDITRRSMSRVQCQLPIDAIPAIIRPSMRRKQNKSPARFRHAYPTAVASNARSTAGRSSSHRAHRIGRTPESPTWKFTVDSPRKKDLRATDEFNTPGCRQLVASGKIADPALKDRAYRHQSLRLNRPCGQVRIKSPAANRNMANSSLPIPIAVDIMDIAAILALLDPLPSSGPISPCAAIHPSPETPAFLQ